ncbi:MAG TPA: hypothetical protein VJC00_00040 [Candidatus Nanoarchaeia archaeon]|nr:hypothetical protein [Candidatus Nanoarchaeia archaeon]
METATVKFQEDVLKKADKFAGLSRAELIKEFMKFRGSAKTKTSDKRLREIREEVGREIIAEFENRSK